MGFLDLWKGNSQSSRGALDSPTTPVKGALSPQHKAIGISHAADMVRQVGNEELAISEASVQESKEASELSVLYRKRMDEWSRNVEKASGNYVHIVDKYHNTAAQVAKDNLAMYTAHRVFRKKMRDIDDAYQTGALKEGVAKAKADEKIAALKQRIQAVQTQF